ncbi:Dyp-type peroxidase domain-containing protein [Tomitella biformata]|uniref:Dyp-type peroxidase domain-containing protein n=1 Tax=Tomitella biformata TaxID=630403 RepID=UPI0004B9ED0D|nr:Dyp-type peroxidase domain-containing protein [Tomitella biformata]
MRRMQEGFGRASSISGDQEWMRGGSYLVARKIAMSIETWDSDALAYQERVSDGTPAMHPNSYVALTHPDNNAGVNTCPARHSRARPACGARSTTGAALSWAGDWTRD